jgi:hypothetical protein
MEYIAIALALFTLAALHAAYTLNRRLNALRSNCSIRNERGQMLRYVNASPEVRARAETTTERKA